MRRVHLPAPARTQRGVALLVFVIALVMAASYTLLKTINQARTDASRNGYTMQQLNHARAALLGYALNGLDPVTALVQPGRLPCPDYTLDGDSDPCLVVSGHVQPGRLPWRTLGLAELRDADNEALWYVPAIEFDGSQPINSNVDTTALRIDGGTDAVVAVILSAGASLAGQSRPPGNLAAQLDPTRYFEDTNALAGTAFVTAPASSSTPFNDHLLAIRLDRFMPALERRVLRELAGVLGNGPFPNPAAAGTKACDNRYVEGLVPVDLDPLLTCDVTTLPAFPNWFRTDWQTLVWYVMDPAATLSIQLAAGGTRNNVRTLLFSPGAALAALGQSPRPAAPVVSDLLDDAENTNGPPVYREPLASPTENDQMLIVAP